jgi:hypothetical protein
MAAFLEDLWTSIFTPGPTSTLLIATNVTFGALQVVLLALLVATYSIHFLVLSVLCAGLWGAINWFANELNAAKAEEERAKASGAAIDPSAEDTAGSAMDTGDDTELESEEIVRPKTIPGTPVSWEALQGVQGVGVTKTTGAGERTGGEEQTPTKPVWNTSIAARLAPQGVDERIRQRNAMKESSSSVSTDGEWEKVDGES